MRGFLGKKEVSILKFLHSLWEAIHLITKMAISSEQALLQIIVLVSVVNIYHLVALADGINWVS